MHPLPFYFYSADAVKDRDGNEILKGNIDAAVFGAALNVVTRKKVLGGTMPLLVVVQGANNRVQGVEDFDSNPAPG